MPYRAEEGCPGPLLRQSNGVCTPSLALRSGPMVREAPCPRIVGASYGAAASASLAAPHASRPPAMRRAIRPPGISPCAPSGPNGSRSAFPPAERVAVLALATQKPATYHGPATRWSLDALVAALPQHRPQPISRSRLWRLLAEADLKPPRSLSWLTSHAPAVAAKALALCQLLPMRCASPTRDASSSARMNKRGGPDRHAACPPSPCRLASQKNARTCLAAMVCGAFLASCVVATGRRVGQLGQTRPRADWAAPLAHSVRQLPAMPRYAWVVEQLPYPLESRGLSARGPMGCRPLAPPGGTPRRPAAGGPRRSDPQVCLSRYAHARLLAQAGGVMVERLGTAFAQAGR